MEAKHFEIKFESICHHRPSLKGLVGSALRRKILRKEQ